MDELCEIARGGSPRPIQSFLTDDPSGINWIKISDATASGKYIYKTAEKIKREGAKRSRVVNPGDFLLSNSMSFGRPYIMKTTGCIHDGWLVLSDKSGLFDQDYLYHFLGSDAAYRQFDSLAAGSTVRNLNIDLAKKVCVPLPPLPEQRRIVAILDEAFAGLETMRANAEKNLANAWELFDGYLNAVFARKGEGWVERRLGDNDLLQIIDGDRGANYPKKDEFFNDGFCLFLNTKNVRPDGFRFDELMFVSKEKDAALRKGKLKRRDVVFTTRGTIGNIAIYDEGVRFNEIRINSGMVIFRPNEKIIRSEYLFEILRASLIKAQIARFVSGAAQPQLPIGTIINFTIPVPTNVHDQSQIIEGLREFEISTSAIESLYRQKLAAIAELKQSLLQKAFAGELTAASVTQAAIRPTTAQSAHDPKQATAIVLALAFERHKRARREKTFAHVKAQKILHMVEAEAGFDLGRAPIKDAAGPNDFPHMLAAEEWAQAHKHFRFPKKADGGHQFIPMDNYAQLWDAARTMDAATREKIERIIDLFVPMDMQEAELFATLYAAWNNLLLEGKSPSDEEIVREAREDWHPQKMKIPQDKFVKALKALKQSDFKPRGRGAKVERAPQGRLAL